MQKIFVAFTVAVMTLGLGLTTGAAQAQCTDKTIRVVNKTRMIIDSLYVSRSSSLEMSRDRLGREVLRPNQSFIIDLDDGSRDRRYDFRAVLENGGEVIRMAVDVCTESQWRVHWSPPSRSSVR